MSGAARRHPAKRDKTKDALIPFTKKAAGKNISHCFSFVSINEISVHFDQFILIISHLKLGHIRELAKAVTGFDAFY